VSNVIEIQTPARFYLRYATEAEWRSDDPVLLFAEPGLEWDKGRVKYGNGVDSWNMLPYSTVTPEELLAKGYLNQQQVNDLVDQKLGLASGLTELVSAFNQAITDSQSSSQALASQLASKATQAALDQEITDRITMGEALSQTDLAEQAARQQAIQGLQNQLNTKVNATGAAAAAPVQSVNNKTGNVNLVKADIGLGSVDNTPDSDKPVSTAQATALSGKIDKQTGAVSGNLAMFATGGGVVDSGIAIPADGVLTQGYQDFTNVTVTTLQITRDDNISSGPLQLSTIPLLGNSSTIVLTSNGDAYPYKSGLFGKITGRITATMTDTGAVTLSGVPATGYQNDIRIWFVYYCPLSASLLTRKTLCPASAQVNLSGLDSAGLATDDDVAGLQTQIDGKEAQITAGQTTQYFDGSKSWRDFGSSVLNSVLTGWQAGADITVSATNTISGAISALQGQITAVKTTLSGKFNAPAGTTSQYLRGDGSVATFPTLGTAAAKDAPSSGNATSGQVVLGSDTRLSDSRPASDVSAWAKEATNAAIKAANVKLDSPLPTQTAASVVAGDDVQAALLKLQSQITGIIKPASIRIAWTNQHSGAWNDKLWTQSGDVAYGLYGSATWQSSRFGIRLTTGTSQAGYLAGTVPGGVINWALDWEARFSLIYNGGGTDPGDGYDIGFGINNANPPSATTGIRIATDPYSAQRNTRCYINGVNNISTQSSDFIQKYVQPIFEYRIARRQIGGRVFIFVYIGNALDNTFELTGLQINYGNIISIRAWTGAAYAFHWLCGFEVWQ
jgi:hypothetical protein